MIDENLKKAYDELSQAFSKLPTEEKRKAVASKINEMSETLNQMYPSKDISIMLANFTSEDEYLCYLNSIVYNLENKIGNIFNSTSSN